MQITLHHHPGRRSPWEARWWVQRRKRTRFFQTEDERTAWLKRARKGLAEHGASALALNPHLMERWQAAQALLGEADPVEVAAWWLAHKGEGTGGLRYEEAVRDYLAAVDTRFASNERTTRLKRALERFRTVAAGRALASITAQEVRTWLEAQTQWSATTVANYRAALSAFFNHFLRLEAIEVNPVAKVTRPEEDTSEEAEILPPETVRQIFEANLEHPDALCLLALMCFAGMRVSAVARIQWDDLDFEAQGIRTAAKKTKKRRREFLQGHPEVLWQWLECARPEFFAPAPPPATGDAYEDKRLLNQWKQTQKRRLEHIRRHALLRAGVLVDAEYLGTWHRDPAHAELRPPRKRLLPANWARHSFGSYHIALHKNAPLTALLMSHRGKPDTLHDHYRGLCSEAEAKAFFAITPPRGFGTSPAQRGGK